MNARPILPLFPTSRVILPGARLVLHVYEPPYMDMLAELAEPSFGTVLAPNTESVATLDRKVGTVVRITGRRHEPGGPVMVAVVGDRRFRILESIRARPYALARVELLGDAAEDAEGLSALAEGLRRAFRRYQVVSAESGYGGDLSIELDTDPVAASYQVASLMRLSNPERQDLLELSTLPRIERELVLLRRETDLLERLMRIGET